VAADSVIGWSAEVPSLLQAQSEEIGGLLHQAYADLGAAGADQASAMVQAFAELMEEAAGQAGSDAASALGDATAEGAGAPLQGLAGALDACASVLAAGEELTGTLAPLVEQLEVVERVIEEVARLLEAME
jgi:hypothetical protein